MLKALVPNLSNRRKHESHFHQDPGFCLLAAALPLLASAQLTGNVSLTTNYKFRGRTRTPARSRPSSPRCKGF